MKTKANIVPVTIQSKNYNKGTKMKLLIISIFIALTAMIYVIPAYATNSDSLGMVPSGGYLRSNIQDTATGPLYLNDVNYLYAHGQRGKRLMLWDLPDSGYAILGYNYSVITPLIAGINRTSKQPWLQIWADSAHPNGLIRLHGNTTYNPPSGYNECLFIDQVSSNGTGIGIYNGAGAGIYIDHSGNQFGMRIENNFLSTGYGLWLDNINTGTAFCLDDSKTGRMMILKQDSTNKPAITCRWDGDQLGYTADSSMLYWWGLKARKVLADSFKGHLYGMADSVRETPDTLKTVLCGSREFGNSEANLRDTMVVSGVSHSTTTVTTSYIYDANATTAAGLQVKVVTDTIFVIRIAATDPDSFYWQALKIKSGAKSSKSAISGDIPTPITGGTTVLYNAAPNPNAGSVSISYQVSNGNERVELAVYNIMGQRIKTLVNDRQAPGMYNITWNGANDSGQKVAAGSYFYQLKYGDYTKVKKMIMLK